MTIEGDMVSGGVGNIALPCRHPTAICLIVNRRSASSIGGPLVSMRGWRVVVGPLPRREQLIVEDYLITCGIL